MAHIYIRFVENELIALKQLKWTQNMVTSKKLYLYIYIKEYSPKTVLCFGVLETLPLIIKVHRETSFRELLYFQSP